MKLTIKTLLIAALIFIGAYGTILFTLFVLNAAIEKFKPIIDKLYEQLT
jgi:hypothetical protein